MSKIPSSSQDWSILNKPARLKALDRTGLMDRPSDAILDKVTALASRLTQAPVSLISLIDHNRQYVASHQGLQEPWCSDRQAPLSHSICKHVVCRNAPVRIEDTEQHELGINAPEESSLYLRAYMGVPLNDPAGEALGSLCVMDVQPRQWTDEQLASLSDLSDVAMELISYRYLSSELDHRVQQRTEELAAYARRLRALTTEAERAAERERERLGHILHDEMQQLLAACRLKVHLIAMEAPQLSRSTNALYELIDEGIHLSRNLSKELFPPGIRNGDFESALRVLTKQMQNRHALAVNLHIQQSDKLNELDENRRSLIYHTLRELLFNITKHAEVNEATVRFIQEPQQLIVEVEDGGKGFDSEIIKNTDENRGLGLFSIEERLMVFHGQLHIQTAPGHGTCVHIILPLM